jgi:hypothetical protein
MPVLNIEETGKHAVRQGLKSLENASWNSTISALAKK